MLAQTRQADVVDIELADGRSIRARRRQGTGSPLVLLHGLLDSSEGWDEITAASPRPSVAFDLPGFGGSDLPTRARVSAYAEDIAAAIRHLELRDVTLVGHSFGGAVATAVAERVPDRLVSLLLLAPAGFGRIALAEFVSLPGVRNAAAAAFPYWLHAPVALRAAYSLFVTVGERAPTEVIGRVTRDAGAALATAAITATEAVVAAGQSKRAFHRRRVAYDGPVAVLWGELDRVVPPRHAEGVKRALPQAQLNTWDGMGHHPQRERSTELCALIEAACRGERSVAGRALGPRAAGLSTGTDVLAAPVPAVA